MKESLVATSNPFEQKVGELESHESSLKEASTKHPVNINMLEPQPSACPNICIFNTPKTLHETSVYVQFIPFQ